MRYGSRVGARMKSSKLFGSSSTAKWEMSSSETDILYVHAFQGCLRSKSKWFDRIVERQEFSSSVAWGWSTGKSVCTLCGVTMDVIWYVLLLHEWALKAGLPFCIVSENAVSWHWNSGWVTESGGFRFAIVQSCFPSRSFGLMMRWILGVAGVEPSEFVCFRTLKLCFEQVVIEVEFRWKNSLSKYVVFSVILFLDPWG